MGSQGLRRRLLNDLRLGRWRRRLRDEGDDGRGIEDALRQVHFRRHHGGDKCGVARDDQDQGAGVWAVINEARRGCINGHHCNSFQRESNRNVTT
jgi:hypothetical protein